MRARTEGWAGQQESRAVEEDMMVQGTTDCHSVHSPWFCW